MAVLIQNFSDMKGFLVILCTLVVAAAVMFLLLFATHPCVRDADACFNGLIEADDFDDTAKGLSSFKDALLTMYDVGIFGAFSVAGFGDTAFPPLAAFVFCFYMLLIMVVALNALIAILGDSFDRAQENKLVNRNRQRAELMIEYLDVMGAEKRRAIEDECRWIHQLVPASLLGRRGNGDEWNGRMAAIRDAIQANTGAIKSEIKEIKSEVKSEIEEVKEKTDALQSEIKEIKSEVSEIKSAVSEINGTLQAVLSALAMKES